MSRIERGMSPAALALSALALVVATSATTAYAGGLIGTNQIADGAVTSPKLHNNAVKSSKVKDASLSAADLSNAAKNKLRVRAFATVSVTEVGDPSFLPGRMRGFTAVERTATGAYCLTLAASAGVDPEKVTAAVTAEWGWSGGNQLEAYWDTGAACDDNEIGVFTQQAGADSNNVAFSVVVP